MATDIIEMTIPGLAGFSLTLDLFDYYAEQDDEAEAEGLALSVDAERPDRYWGFTNAGLTGWKAAVAKEGSTIRGSGYVRLTNTGIIHHVVGLPINEIWSAGERTLTEPAGEVPPPGTGPDLRILAGSRWRHSISGLGSLAGYSKIWITGKKSLSDPDSKAIFQIEKTAGLIVLNRKTAGLTALDGSITIDDLNAGNLTFEMLPPSTVQLESQALLYDIKAVIPPNDAMQRTAGRVNVIRNVTRAFS